MDALNFLKFWKNATMTSTTSSSTTTLPHLVVETDSESDEEDSFFDLELTLHDFDNKEKTHTNNKTDHYPQIKTTLETKQAGLDDYTEVDVPQKGEKSTLFNEPISKRKVLPIEPISKPQSPIALLKSAPSFRIFMFKKQSKRMTPQKEENQKKETRVFSVKLNVEEFQSTTPVLSRDNSTRSFGSRLRNHGSEEAKTERFSKDVVQKYLKLIKPLYVRVSKRYSEKIKFSEEGSMASPLSSPSVAGYSVSSRREKQGNFPAGMRGVSKHLGKSRSSPTVARVGSPAKRSDDTMQEQHDGIQSAILHCKRSFNSRDSSVSVSTEGSLHSLRSSFEEENGANV